MRLRALALLALAAAAAPFSNTRAFELLDASWASGSADFWIYPNFPNPERAGTPEEQVEVLCCAASVWHDQSRAAFEFNYSGTTTAGGFNKSDGKNTISFSSKSGGDALAITILRWDRGVAESFDIVFFGSTGGEENSWSGPEGPGGIAGPDMGGIGAHELGHALGLDHSPLLHATMYGGGLLSGGFELVTLHPDDQAGVEAIYGLRTEEAPHVEIVSVSPGEGPAAGGNEVVIEGVSLTSDYDSETEILVGGVDVPKDRWAVESCHRLRILRMPAHAPGLVDIRVSNALGSSTAANAYRYAGDSQFIRGDSNSDGRVDISDPVFHLESLFRGGPAGACDDASDATDDGMLDISDSIRVLTFLFQGSGDLPPPYPEAGIDPTSDSLACGGTAP